jgi:hypothetical protein
MSGKRTKKRQRKPSQVSIRSGQVEFVKVGTDAWRWRDVYRWLLGLRWPAVRRVCRQSLRRAKLFFAALYSLQQDSIAGSTGGHWFFWLLLFQRANTGHGWLWPHVSANALWSHRQHRRNHDRDIFTRGDDRSHFRALFRPMRALCSAIPWSLRRWMGSRRWWCESATKINTAWSRPSSGSCSRATNRWSRAEISATSMFSNSISIGWRFSRGADSAAYNRRQESAFWCDCWVSRSQPCAVYSISGWNRSGPRSVGSNAKGLHVARYSIRPPLCRNLHRAWRRPAHRWL